MIILLLLLLLNVVYSHSYHLKAIFISITCTHLVQFIVYDSISCCVG